MDMELATRITRAQQRLYRCIEDELRRDGHHKSYEGAVEVTMSLPNYFEQHQGITWLVEFHCYVLCNGRHETWHGKTLAEAVAQFEAWSDKVAMPYEMTRFERDMGLNEDEPGEADGSVKIYADKRQVPE